MRGLTAEVLTLVVVINYGLIVNAQSDDCGAFEKVISDIMFMFH